MIEQVIGIAKRFFFGLVYFDPERNVRDHNINKTESKFKGLVSSFVREGWKTNASQFWATASPMTDEESAKYLLLRQQELASYEQAAKQQGLESEVGYEYAARKALYCDADGVVITPKYLGAMGHQRAFAYPYAMAARLRGSGVVDVVIGQDCPNTVETTIPVVIVEYASELERLDAMVDENNRKTEGFTPMSDSDNLHTALKMVKLNATQQDLRNRFTPSMGQKLWGICKLSLRFPRLQLISRICNTDENGAPLKDDRPDYLPFGKIKGAELPNVLIASALEQTQESLDQYNSTQRDKKKNWVDLHLMDEGAVNALFEAYKTGIGGGNKVKMMSKDDLTSLSTSENFVIRKTALAILNNDRQQLAILSVIHAGSNALANMAMSSGIGDINALLVALEESKDNADFAQVCQSVRSYVASLKTPTNQQQKAKKQKA